MKDSKTEKNIRASDMLQSKNNFKSIQSPKDKKKAKEKDSNSINSFQKILLIIKYFHFDD